MAEEAKITDDKTKECCATGNNSRTVVLVIVLVLVAIGLAAVLKLTVFNHKAGFGKNFSMGRFENSDQPRGREGNGNAAAIGSEGCPLHSGNASVTITAISGNKLTVRTSGKDQTVNITPDTSIVKDGEIAAKVDLKVNDEIVVKGTSNSAGEIVAKSINIK